MLVSVRCMPFWSSSQDSTSCEEPYLAGPGTLSTFCAARFLPIPGPRRTRRLQRQGRAAGA
eukprot:5916417-Alexandrium_andersonii.AAC.1